MTRAERRALRAASRQLAVAARERVLWIDPCGWILMERERLEYELVRRTPRERVWRWRASWLPWWIARSCFFLLEQIKGSPK
jgi:hypothetical protein